MACSGPVSMDTPAGPAFRRCNQCLPCRIQRQSSITFRCALESQVAWSGQFLTLTYEEAPEVGSYVDMQMFLDRLRVRNRREGNSLAIRYLAIGEYGDLFGRFHYHALVWNSLSFDQVDWHTKLWPYGFSQVGTITPGSIRYVTRYTTKFLEKDQDRLPRGESRKPPLGEPVMKLLAQQHLDRGHTESQPPTTIRWNGKRWPVDTAMQIAWAEVTSPDLVRINASGTRTLARSAVAAHTDYMTTIRLGDPFADWRKSRERSWLARHREMENRVSL